MNAVKYREVLNEDLLQSAHNVRLGQKSIYSLKHTAKIMLKWTRDTSLNVLEWPN